MCHDVSIAVLLLACASSPCLNTDQVSPSASSMWMHVTPVVCVCACMRGTSMLHATCSKFSSCAMLSIDCARCSHPALTHPQCCHTHHQRRSYLERPHYSSSVSCEERHCLGIINWGWYAVHTPLDIHVPNMPTNAQVRNPHKSSLVEMAHFVGWVDLAVLEPFLYVQGLL